MIIFLLIGFWMGLATVCYIIDKARSGAATGGGEYVPLPETSKPDYFDLPQTKDRPNLKAVPGFDPKDFN